MWSIHSIEEGRVAVDKIGRTVDIISHKIIKNIKRAQKDNIDPAEDNVFHFVKKSG